MIKDKRLKIIFFGDVVGKPGRAALSRVLPEIKKEFEPDLIIANIENLAHGKGVTEKTLAEVRTSGVDVFTSGEHIYDKATDEAAQALFSQFTTLLKPMNFAPERPGRGEVVIDTSKGKVRIVSLIGQVFIPFESLSPWEMLEEILARKDSVAATFVDLHAEATSEKVAMGQHFDGRISALVGTHTHIPTADATILPGGTAYVTDVGMNGPIPSVLGMESSRSIGRFITREKIAYDVAQSNTAWLNYVIIEIDTTSGKATNIKHIHKIVNI